MRRARPTSSSGVAITSSRRAEELEGDVRREATALALGPGGDLGRRRLRARSEDSSAISARSRRGAAGRRRRGDSCARRRAARRAGSRRGRGRPAERHRLHEDGAAAAEGVEHAIAGRAPALERAARDRRVEAAGVAVEAVGEARARASSTANRRASARAAAGSPPVSTGPPRSENARR
jgi:hypothetical protein